MSVIDDFQKLFRQVDDTDGWSVAVSKGWLTVANPFTPKPIKIRAAVKSNQTYLTIVRQQLAELGWTEQAYLTQVAERRAAKMAEVHRNNDKLLARVAVPHSQPELHAPAPVAKISHEVYTVSELITPERAAEVLAKFNHCNRPIRPSRIKYLTDIVDSGRWVDDNPDGIAFDWDGYLLNGQHRLTVIVNTGISLTIRVTYNVSPGSFSVIDDVAPRTASDMLSIVNVDAARLAAPTLKLLFMMENEKRESWRRVRIAPNEFPALLEMYGRDEIGVACTDAQALRRLGMVPSAGAAASYLIRKAWPQGPYENFLDTTVVTSLRAKIGSDDDPRLALYRWMANTKERDAWVHMGILIKAWNAYVVDRPLKVLVMRVSEPFPKPTSPSTRG